MSKKLRQSDVHGEVFKSNTELSIAMATIHHGNSKGVLRATLVLFPCGFVRALSDKQRAELTQQHTEWSRQMTQRHMQQIEDLQAQLQAHTQMMALQQVTHTPNHNALQKETPLIYVS